MGGDLIVFCDQINDCGRIIENAQLADLRELVARVRRSGDCNFSLIRTSDMDSEIELVGGPEGTAIFGCEDSRRGTFSFYYCDPAKNSNLLPIGIHEVPRHSLCDELECAIQIAELFFRDGELDRRFPWALDVRLSNGAKRRTSLAIHENLSLEALVARTVKDQAT